MSAEAEAVWKSWLDGLDGKLKSVAETLPPWKRYRMAETGHVVNLESFQEGADGSVAVTVTIHPDENDSDVFIPRRVFGVAPDDLSEID